MSKRRERLEEIRKYILRNVELHSRTITALVAEEFGISRQAAVRHIRKLVDEGLLNAEGNTRNREYSLRPLRSDVFQLQLADGIEEDEVWREYIGPLLEAVPDNVKLICQYGFTEMLNNVVAHSEAKSVLIYFEQNALQIEMTVIDDGIGIFEKIQQELGLSDKRHAILELTKGKLTTDPDRHTGEGIFFTSRVFDHFSISSGDLYFAHSTDGDDWLLESTDQDDKVGTSVSMEISPESERKLKDVFDYYAGGDEFGFTRTHVPVALARYSDENLISRSQARRLLTRFDRFKEVFLNFDGVETIGQAFADEIFRVYAKDHPEIDFIWVNGNEEVGAMIERAISRKTEEIAPGNSS